MLTGANSVYIARTARTIFITLLVMDGKGHSYTPGDEKRSGPNNYSLILQVKQGGACSKLTTEEIERHLKFTPSGKFYCDPELPDSILKSYMITFVTVANKFDDIVVTYHNGNEHTDCEFNGYHWHVAAYCNIHPSRDSRWGRKLLDISNASAETVFSCQVIKSAPALVRHIVKAPRKLVGMRGERYAPFVGGAEEVEPEEEKETSLTGSPDWDRTNLKQDSTYFRITNLSKLMAKYQTPDVGVLTQKVRMNKKDWPKLLELKCAASWDTVSKKAAELYCSEECVLPLDERMAKAPKFSGETETWLSPEQSHLLFQKWIDWNGFDKEKFVDQLFAVLARRDKKKNTFMLQGSTCAGKSWVLRSLTYYYPFYGEVHGMGNYNFAYQGCLDKALIFIEEPMLEPATVDHAKQVLEGAPTLVNIKCKPPQTLQPTPVLITSNHDLWKWCPGEKETLMTRMYHWTCKRAPWLQQIQKSLHPIFWYRLYHNWQLSQDHDFMTAAEQIEEQYYSQITDAPPRENKKRKIDQDDLNGVRKSLFAKDKTEGGGPKTPPPVCDVREKQDETADTYDEFQLPMADADGNIVNF